MKILILPDNLNWILGFIADAVIKHIPEIEFVKKRIPRKLRRETCSKYDRVFVMYPPQLKEFDPTSSRFLCGINSFTELQIQDPNKDTIRESDKNRLNQFVRVSAPCKLMYDYLAKYQINAYYTPYGFDPDKFYPLRKKRNKKLVFGFAGNPDNHKTIKGYYDYILPAFQQIPEVELKTATGGIPHGSMIEFYNSIDVLVCMSSTEGAYSPLLESMACGTPLITTSVGLVPEIVKPLRNGIIIKRSIDELVEWIEFLKNNRDIIELMKKNAYNDIQSWTWEKVIRHWREFLVAI